MRALLINSVCGIRSTGRICVNNARELEQEGYEVKIAYGRETVPAQYEKYAVRIGNTFDVRLHGLRSRLLDDHGLASVLATRRFLAWAEAYDPDLLWLHNIHGYYINYELLFAWIKSRPKMKVRWTLHDCWSFTGHCAHFTMIKCEKWKQGCMHCPQKKRYPASYLKDNSEENFARKKAAFTGVCDMTLITPSKWLAGLVSQSFLKGYPIEVRGNTIDTSVFRPTPGDFRARYALEDKVIVLGVASAWSKEKGLEDFYRLSELLDERYQIVLVGLTREQLAVLPAKILGLGRTNDPRELAEIYTAADAFVNPTYEDTYPTVNLEAEACGTRVVTYDAGGCGETIRRGDSALVPEGDINGLIEWIERNQ